MGARAGCSGSSLSGVIRSSGYSCIGGVLEGLESRSRWRQLPRCAEDRQEKQAVADGRGVGRFRAIGERLSRPIVGKGESAYCG